MKIPLLSFTFKYNFLRQFYWLMMNALRNNPFYKIGWKGLIYANFFILQSNLLNHKKRKVCIHKPMTHYPCNKLRTSGKRNSYLGMLTLECAKHLINLNSDGKYILSSSGEEYIFRNSYITMLSSKYVCHKKPWT